MSTSTKQVTKNQMRGIIVIIVLIVLFACSFMLMENVDAESIMVVQAPLSGKLTWHVTAGVKSQMFGKVTTYPKRSIYEFEIPVRFNDGGHGTMFGSIQYEMPLDAENLTALHTRFGSAEAIQKQLIETITNKSVYMTGPLMSSKESYAEKRNYLIHYVEDQITNGVYKTTQREMKIRDAMTDIEKTVVVVEIVMGTDGFPQRQEEAVLTKFGIKAFNFAINKLPYDPTVEKQITEQQAIAMDVQTAIANSKKAEQRAITVAKEGEANAAEAKWIQETIKAQKVTEAQQKMEVAEFEMKAAEFTKQQQIKLGQGEAERKRLVMSADGALELKLAAWENVQGKWADALSQAQPGALVPSIVMGGGSGKGGTFSASDWMSMLGMQAAKDLSLDMKVPAGRTGGGSVAGPPTAK